MLLPVAILAGGLATRLRPLTEKIPKALIDVEGEPFIAHQLRLLRSKGIQRVVVCAGYLGELIQNYVRNGKQFGLEVDYSFERGSLMGTGGAVKKALPLLGRAFFILYGDSYLPCDYRAVHQAFADSGKKALMTIFHNRGNWDTSNVEFRKGQIIAYDKQTRTPRMAYIDYGLGVFREEAFDRLPAGQPYDLARLYQSLLQKGELGAFEVAQRFYEIGSWQGLEEMKRLVANQKIRKGNINHGVRNGISE
jgi:N-acetyl-alpha-D-muramate 1-phosphate uridylyltransferase